MLTPLISEAPDLPGGLAGDHAPPWLADEAAWRAVCEREAQTYEQIGRWLDDVSDARERAKLALLRRLAAEHGRVLAFDRHLITLALLHRGLQDDPDVHEVLLATGQARTARRRVERLFAPDAPDGARVVALCSDAMNEGINLQGASAMVHLDLPTTLRVAEQRVGRVDRMDSPHDSIAAWWPADGPAFATRARERFVERLEESGALLGRNLPVPDLGTGSLPALDDDATVDPHQVHEEVEEALAAPDDGIDDALEPVRHLVHGPDALVARGDYLAHRTTRHRVLARVSPVASTRPWAFLSVRTSLHGAPRWMLVDPASSPTCETDLRLVVDRLRQALAGDPEDRPVDGRAEQQLDQLLDLAARAEVGLLPRRLQRALAQLQEVTRTWATAARRAGDESTGARWSTLARLTEPSSDQDAPDRAVVAETWLELTAARTEAFRATKSSRRPYVLIGDVTPGLQREPLPLDVVEAAMREVPVARPLAQRVAACILGVPDD